MSVRTVLSLAVGAAVLVTGCSIQARKDRAAMLSRASETMLRLPPHDARLTATIRPREVNGRRITSIRVDGRRVRVSEIPLPQAAVALDLPARRSVVVVGPAPGGTLGQEAATGLPDDAGAAPTTPAADPTSPATATRPPRDAPPAGLTTAASQIVAAFRRVPDAVAFSRWDIFVRPNAASVAQGSGVQGGAGVWLWLDVDALDPDRETSLVTPTPVLVLAPHVLYLLLEGALTGSVDDLGHADVSGVDTRHLRFNIDRDKAARDLGDKDTQRLKRLFDAANIDGTFFDGAEAWVGPDGVVRRLTVRLPQRTDALTSYDLSYTLELGAPRTDPLPLPSNEDLAEVPTLPELLPGTAA